VLQVTGTVAAAATRLGIVSWHLSLTHDGGVAVAMVVAES
jgi:holo-[acyl-carrier protein] synthase